MKEEKIPKIIHYCWFGKGEKSDLAKRCIKGWKERLKEYEIVEWNEENFNINLNEYVKEAYSKKKYAFVSDYVRLYALLNYGGIYMDTDVEVLRNFDSLLDLQGFAGFEDMELISTATIGARKGNSLIEEWLCTYNDRHFIKNGKIDNITNVRVFTKILLNHGLKQNNQIQEIDNGRFTIHPTEYFSPLKFSSKKPKITQKTISVHWFEGTWLTIGQILRIKLIIIIKGILGFRNYNKIKAFIRNERNNE